jgi:hypothetical protein
MQRALQKYGTQNVNMSIYGKCILKRTHGMYGYVSAQTQNINIANKLVFHKSIQNNSNTKPVNMKKTDEVKTLKQRFHTLIYACFSFFVCIFHLLDFYVMYF